MAVALEPLTFDRFKGIREFNGVNYGGEISAIECENVELVQTEIGNNTGIKTMGGNSERYVLSDPDYKTIGDFVSEQDNVVYRFIYAETEAKGTLFYINISDEPTVLVDDLTVTGKCNGLTMSSSAYDVFVFTNGEEAYTVCFTSDAAYGAQVKPLNFMYGWRNGTTYKYTITRNPAANDYVYEANGDKTETQITSVTPSEGVVTSINVGETNYSYDGKKTKTDKDGGKQYIKFLAMAVWNGRLVVATDYGVRASHDNNIYKWNDTNINDASSWYINYTEKVTALYAYTGGLFIFTDDNTDFLNANPNNASSMLVTTAGVGCHSFDSIVKHDTYLFFYSNIQKNIYMIQNIDNGQTRPTGPLAKEVQSAFNNVKDLKMYSCIYDNKNQIWVLITDKFNNFKIYIYDYNQGEWVRREESKKINTLCVTGNAIYTGAGNKIYIEFLNNINFFKSMYRTCFINAGSNTNIKKQKTPLLIVLNDNYVNDFYVRLTVNGKQKKEKHIELKTIASGVYGSINETLDVQPVEQTYGSTLTETPCAHYGTYNPYSKKVIEVSTPQTWYTMGIEIYTKTAGQGFYIYSMELKNMKAKLKTRGR